MISYFVILGILFLAIIVLSSTIYYSFRQQPTTAYQSEITSFETAIMSCYNKIVPQKILDVNIRSGKKDYDYFTDGFLYGDYEISKYLVCTYNTTTREKEFYTFLPTVDDVSYELSSAIEEDLDDCLIDVINNYKDVFNASYSHVLVNTLIEEKKVSVAIKPNMQISTEIQNNNYTYTLPLYTLHYAVDDYNYIYSSEHIIDSIMEQNGVLNLSGYISYNLIINITAYPGEIYLFDLYDNKSNVVVNKELTESHYLFAVDLSCRR